MKKCESILNELSLATPQLTCNQEGQLRGGFIGMGGGIEAADPNNNCTNRWCINDNCKNSDCLNVKCENDSCSNVKCNNVETTTETTSTTNTLAPSSFVPMFLI